MILTKPREHICYFLFFILLLAYIIIHYATLTQSSSEASSNIDYLYGFFLLSGLIICLLSFLFRKKFLKTLRFNFILLTLFIILLEISFIFKIISNVAIRPIPINFNIKKLNVIKLKSSPWFKFSANKKYSLLVIVVMILFTLGQQIL